MKTYRRWIHWLVWMVGHSSARRNWTMNGGAALGEFWFEVYDLTTEDSFRVWLAPGSDVTIAVRK